MEEVKDVLMTQNEETLELYCYTRLELKRDLGMIIPRGVEPVNLGTGEPKYDRRECVSRQETYETLRNLPGGLVSDREITRYGSQVLPGVQPVAKLVSGGKSYDLYPRHETVPYCKLYYRYDNWDRVPEFYKTRHALEKIGLKPAREIPHVARIYSGRAKNEYYLYDIKDCVPIRGRDIVLPDMSEDNLAKALYVINKSAKRYRDTKKRNYRLGSYALVSRSKRHERELYALKDQVINIMLKKGIANILGIHEQVIGHRKTVYPFGREDYDMNDNEFYNDFDEDFFELDEDRFDRSSFESFQRLSSTEQETFLNDYARWHGYQYVTYDSIFEEFEARYEEKNFLLFIGICDFTFHRPATYKEREQYPSLGEIGVIRSKTKQNGMGVKIAKELLEAYVEDHQELLAEIEGEKRCDEECDLDKLLGWSPLEVK